MMTTLIITCMFSFESRLRMRRNDLFAVAIACASALVPLAPCGAAGQASGSAWAQTQQAALAEDILSGDEDQRHRAVFVAEALGPERMSEDVRVALITLLEQCDDARQEARRQGIPLSEVVDFEFFMWVAEVVATLKDPRAIPALTRVGDHGYSLNAVLGLASFGERALPAILKILDAPESSSTALSYNMKALSIMVERIGAKDLSERARGHIVRVARDGLRSQDGGVLLKAVDLAVALNEPDMAQAVLALSHDSGELVARGVGPSTANLIREKATAALARAPNGRSGQ